MTVVKEGVDQLFRHTTPVFEVPVIATLDCNSHPIGERESTTEGNDSPGAPSSTFLIGGTVGAQIAARAYDPRLDTLDSLDAPGVLDRAHPDKTKKPCFRVARRSSATGGSWCIVAVGCMNIFR
jgi:hypothetical protein